MHLLRIAAHRALLGNHSSRFLSLCGEASETLGFVSPNKKHTIALNTLLEHNFHKARSFLLHPIIPTYDVPGLAYVHSDTRDSVVNTYDLFAEASSIVYSLLPTMIPMRIQVDKPSEYTELTCIELKAAKRNAAGPVSSTHTNIGSMGFKQLLLQLNEYHVTACFFVDYVRCQDPNLYHKEIMTIARLPHTAVYVAGSRMPKCLADTGIVSLNVNEI